MPAREQAQERVQLGALLVVEVGEELRLEPLGERAELRVRALALGRDAHGVAPAVVRVAAALDEPLLLELVEQPDELAPVVAERVGDRALRLGRALVEQGEDGVVVRVQPGCLVRLERLAPSPRTRAA